MNKEQAAEKHYLEHAHSMCGQSKKESFIDGWEANLSSDAIGFANWFIKTRKKMYEDAAKVSKEEWMKVKNMTTEDFYKLFKTIR